MIFKYKELNPAILIRKELIDTGYKLINEFITKDIEDDCFFEFKKEEKESYSNDIESDINKGDIAEL